MRSWILLFLLIISLNLAAQEKLQYHTIKVDGVGFILPWYDADPALAYDHILTLVWNFWDTMRRDYNGLPYYLNHQVWRPQQNDPRGLGGDQLMMAMESWRLLYAYTGDERIKENIRFMADYYLSHSLSDKNDTWSLLPYPYNTLIYSGQYDGDMILGKDFLQPDKAGSFGYELLQAYKLTAGEVYPNISKDRYLQAAIDIANTLAVRIQIGDEKKSPLPFKVNAKNGEVGVLYLTNSPKKDTIHSEYTTNWSATLRLWNELAALKVGNYELYQKAFNQLLSWMTNYPMKNNKWGPFFEDIPGWSDTQINAVTFAQFIMDHKSVFPSWKKEVRTIFDWVYKELGNTKWKAYGVTPINEQTAYRVPGNSHTSRQAAAQLQFAFLSGDTSHQLHSIRQLNWASYMVDVDGKNKYLQDENWLTDGYGDFVRHYLKAMNYHPVLAPPTTHLLSSSSVVQHAFYNGIPKYYFPAIKEYQDLLLHYTVFDKFGMERIRLPFKPGRILFDGKIQSLADSTIFDWQDLKQGGLLVVHRQSSNHVSIYR